MWSSNNFSVRIIPEPCKPPVESSPRMQGALPSTENHSKHYRIIPANAGSTFSRGVSRPCAGDHPRGCGEHSTLKHSISYRPGSSPRMRGARSFSPSHACDRRIIPADAGSTMHNMTNTQHSTGSSPRMRGALYKYGLRLFPRQDHPRGCGEHSDLWIFLVWLPGSSPRMRGALYRIPDGFLLVGIIPADAGSTEDKLNNFDVQSGPSPRMRGAPHVRGGPAEGGGIIPADAGSTSV